MKKTLKSIIAATLVLVILLCSVPVFAAEHSETIKWYGTWSQSDEYYYEGELQQDKVEFDEDIPNSIYYTFSASEDGYYLLTRENGWLAFFEPEEIRTDGYYGEKYCDVDIGIISENGYFADLFYLEEGEHIFGVTYGEGTASPTSLAECGGFSFEYCGKEVTDLGFGENTLELIADCDVLYNEHSSEYERVPYAARLDDVTVTFSGGNTVKLDENRYDMYSENELIEGENTVTFEFLGYEEDAEITLCPVSQFIKSVEIGNIEKHTEVKEFYDGSFEYYNDGFIDEKVTVTFTDGTKTSCTIEPFGFNEIELPNGRKYHLGVSYEKEDNNAETSLYIFVLLEYNCNIAVYECDVKQATTKENLDLLDSNIENSTYWEINNIKDLFYETFVFESVFELADNINTFISSLIINLTVILEFVNAELDLFIEWTKR